jgi:hypothetical protein
MLPDKLIVAQAVQKFPAFYGTQRFTTVFTRVIRIHFVHTFIRSISVILFFYLFLGLPSGLFLSGLFPLVVMKLE